MGLKPYFETELGKLYCGDAVEVLKKLPKESVDLVVTSPPYWAKRDYGKATLKVWGGDPDCDHEWVPDRLPPTKFGMEGHRDPKYKSANTDRPDPGMVCRKCGAWYGQLGLEPTPQMFVEHLVEVFREVRRVLKPTGSLFVNIDDTWAGAGSGNDTKKPKSTSTVRGLKKKSLALVPELFAVKMVYEEGWILREKIIWAKKVHLYKDRTTKGNAMPESVKDRFSHTWEYIFHFTKRQKYYFNLDAVRVPLKESTIKRAMYGWNFDVKSKSDEYPRSTKQINYELALKIRSKYLSEDAVNTHSMRGELIKIMASGDVDKKALIQEAITNVNAYLKQKLRESGLSVKKLAEITGIKETQLVHYFRTDLSGVSIPPREVWEVLKPILGLDDYEKHVKEEYKKVIPSSHPLGVNPGDVVQINVKPFNDAHFAVFPPELPEMLIKVASPPDGVVLDPFAGAGTTLVVAERLGRRWVGIEMNPDYCDIIVRRFERELGDIVKTARLDKFLKGGGA